MNIDDLNKNQIVLLVLLVSFVTSIATGIVTVTLMDQAPAGVTQTINRVVERTVERVVPGPTQTATVIKEVPVIITEEDQIISAIKNSEPAILKVVAANDPEKMISSGFIFSDDGLVATIMDASTSSSKKIKYQAILANGDKKDLEFVREVSGIMVMRLPHTEVATDKFTFLELADGELSVGQTVLAIGAPLSSSEPNISISKIGAILMGNASSTPEIKTIAASRENFGGPVLNIKGKVVGISKGAGLATNSQVIMAPLASADTI